MQCFTQWVDLFAFLTGGGRGIGPLIFYNLKLEFFIDYLKLSFPKLNAKEYVAAKEKKPAQSEYKKILKPLSII